jgi:uncharacterized membrane-anchored protein
LLKWGKYLIKMATGMRSTLRKVPEITIYFWIIKLLTTALGEAISDFLVYKYNPYLVVLSGAAVFSVALAIQFWVRSYNAWIYWFTVAMVAIFGTMVADSIHIQLGIPYSVSVVVFGIALAGIFFAWKKTENSLSIHSITTCRREVFYWATVLATFALGTAAGDLTAYSLGLGYFSSILVFVGIFAVPTLGFLFFRMGSVLAFWFAYIITRPIGASVADWTAKPHRAGGLAYGDLLVIAVLAILAIGLVGYLAVSRHDIRTQTSKPSY